MRVSASVLKNVCVSVCKFAAEGGKLQTRVPPLIPKCIKYERRFKRGWRNSLPFFLLCELSTVLLMPRAEIF